MAAPHVSGTAALYLALNPHAPPSEVAAALTGKATPGIIVNAGIGSPNLALYTGVLADDPLPPPPVWPTPTPTPSPPPPPPPDNPPIASFTFTLNRPRAKCSFDPSGSADDKGIASYRWDFGDGKSSVSSSAIKVSHTYSVIGNYDVTLTVTDAAGQQGKATQVVRVRKN